MGALAAQVKLIYEINTLDSVTYDYYLGDPAGESGSNAAVAVDCPLLLLEALALDRAAGV
jgi:hypothetical protein